MYQVQGHSWDSDEFVSEHFDQGCTITPNTAGCTITPNTAGCTITLGSKSRNEFKNHLDMTLVELGASPFSFKGDAYPEPEYELSPGNPGYEEHIEYLRQKASFTHDSLDKDLEDYFRPQGPRLLISGIEGHSDIYPTEGFKAAGCLFYGRSGNDLYFLLEKRVDSPWYYDLGGRRMEGENVYECASREVYEESNGMLSLEGATYLGIFEQYGFFVKHLPPIHYDFGTEDFTGVRRNIGWVKYDSSVKLSARIPRHILF